MPSTLIGAQSGGVPLWSGGLFSGALPPLVGGVQLRSARSSSGNIYVGFSGGLTITSGGGMGSGGANDGMEMAPGDPYFIPRVRLQNQHQSGASLWATAASTVSGFVRLFVEGF